MTVTFDALDPSRIAAHIKELEEVTKEMPGIFKAYLCSNGCDAQLCLRFGIWFDFRNGKEIQCHMVLQRPTPQEMFNLRNRRDSKEHDLPWFQTWKSPNHHHQLLCIICRSVREQIKSIYHASSDILQEPNDIESYLKIHWSLEVNMVKGVFTEDGACKLKFFKMAAEDEPFYQHWYRCEGDREVCDHPGLPLF